MSNMYSRPNSFTEVIYNHFGIRYVKCQKEEAVSKRFLLTVLNVVK